MKRLIFSVILVTSLFSPLFAKTVGDISLPSGFQRIDTKEGSFSRYLRNLNLKEDGKVYSYRKKDLSHWYDSLGVIDKPLLFSDDLEQCADFSMRLWADYHKDSGKLKDLYLFHYDGRKNKFTESQKTYVQFLRTAFASSNSHSLKQGGKKITKENLTSGDLFVQNENGGIGHVSIILDESTNGKERLYLIAFSFMPAQEMHIEKAPSDRGKNGWFTYEGFIEHLKEKYPYGTPVLRRF